MDANRAHSLAAKLSVSKGEPIAVVETDKYDGRTTTVMLESDTQYDEFIAFCGVIIAVYIDGEMLD